MPFISIEHLTRVFQSQGLENGLRDFSAGIQSGALHVILGPSGAGKTTLLRIIAGLEKPDSGRILFDNREVTGVEGRDRDVAIISQNACPLPHLTVAENLALPLQLRKDSRADVRRSVEEMAMKLGIQDWLERSAGDLSGGEAQKVCLGRAMIRGASLLLMDEPFAHLDQPRRLEFRRFLKKLHQESKTTILFVTHDQAEASSLATECTVMIQGGNHQTGSFQQLARHPNTSSVASFIGSPPMNVWAAAPLEWANLFPLTLGDPDKIVIGLPPEKLSPDPSPGWLKVVVTDVIYETHGAQIYGYGITKKGETAVFAPSMSRPTDTARLELFFDPKAAHYFCSETGRKIKEG